MRSPGYILYGPEFREGWGKGPWQDEPDEVVWHIGRYRCQIWRQPDLGHLCGYVSVDRSHPAYKLREEARDLDMHGGCTYTRREGNRWKIGFDCGHSGDLVPQINFMRQPGELLGDIPGARKFHEHEVYRGIAFVEHEINLVILQLEAMRAETKGKIPPQTRKVWPNILAVHRKQRKRHVKWPVNLFGSVS